MTPLGRTALGLLLVLLDLRLQGFDAVPDVLGWILVVVGLGELALRCPALTRARTAAVVAGVLSLADLVHPTRTTTTGGGGPYASSSTAAVPPEGLQGLLSFGSLVAGIVVVVLLSLRLRDLASTAGDAGRARTFGRFAVWHITVGGLAALVGLVSLVTSSAAAPDVQVDADLQGPAGAVVIVLVLAVLVVELAFLLALRRARHEPWVLPEWAVSPPSSGGDGPIG